MVTTLINIPLFIFLGIPGIAIATIINVFIIKNQKYERIFQMIMLSILCCTTFVAIKLELQKIPFSIVIGFLLGLTFGFNSKTTKDKK